MHKGNSTAQDISDSLIYMFAYTVAAVSCLLSHLLGHVTGLALLHPTSCQSIKPRNNGKGTSRRDTERIHTHIHTVLRAAPKLISNDVGNQMKDVICEIHVWRLGDESINPQKYK